MAKRKKPKQRTRDKNTVALGVAWYRREQWKRLLEVSQDRDILEATYDDWKAHAESELQKLERSGILFHKVDVDVDELLQWCKSQKRPVDGESRALFTAARLREMHEERK